MKKFIVGYLSKLFLMGAAVLGSSLYHVYIESKDFSEFLWIPTVVSGLLGLQIFEIGKD